MNKAIIKKAEVEELAKQLDESTSLSPLWSWLFGCIWCLYVGSVRWFFIYLLLFPVGIVVYPFLAYAVHRSVAYNKALKLS